MQKHHFFTTESKVTPENLGEAIQQAIEIEIATIPVYLYTYYSLNRSPNQNVISGALARALVQHGKKTQEEANEIAIDMSAEIMVYANKAGALIMSIAIEEMLHMALSSNLKQVLAGLPQLVGKSPSVWPACLPGHEPEFPINRAPFSLDQLMTFLKIESPDPLPEHTHLLKAIPYKTIGQFYDIIKKCIMHNDLNYRTFLPQLVPGKGYYANNNIDTVYYDKQHKPQFVNADDSGDLIYIKDRESAIHAIDEIVEQGEGNPDAPGLNPDGSVNCGAIVPADYDDKAREELSHFSKFALLYCEYETLTKKFNSLGIGKINISDYFVVNFPTNPKTLDYPAQAQAVSNLLNAVYTYIFVMTEGCYKKSGSTQYEIFMFGIHKSMIFILNSLCGDITGMTYVSPEDGETYVVAPTFEDYPFGLLSSPKSQLISLYNTAVAAYPKISYLGQRFQDLPDVAL